MKGGPRNKKWMMRAKECRTVYLQRLLRNSLPEESTHRWRHMHGVVDGREELVEKLVCMEN